ncbi:cytidine deaminase [Chryseobacterium flavum]|uniref:Cytidine deaminase n=1 Tax=Chryseobacterium flavum TaxID=415851 RepID=A0A3D9CPQ2_9FLAO|nr:cytidine deaminase [Chryseobacterium flavum]REC67661.1 cytidine deaminase [Chryseobacterium flavum]
MENDLKGIARRLAGIKVLNDYVEYGGIAAAIPPYMEMFSIDTACSMGFCAEHSTVAEMLKHGEYHIKALVAVDHEGNAVPPCGRCRELISQLSRENLKAIIEVKNGVFVMLKELIPFDWKEGIDREW